MVCKYGDESTCVCVNYEVLIVNICVKIVFNTASVWVMTAKPNALTR